MSSPRRTFRSPRPWNTSSNRASSLSWLLRVALACATLYLTVAAGAVIADKQSALRSRVRSERSLLRRDNAVSVANHAAAPVPVALSGVTRTVDTTADDPALTACTAGPNDCSLRGAISGAASGDTIAFSLPAGSIIQLDVSLGEIPINASLSITGPGNITVSGRQLFPSVRVFNVGNTANVTVSVSGLTIANGGAPSTDPGGGGVRNNAAAP